MPGIHTILFNGRTNDSPRESYLSDALLEDYFRIKTLTQTPKCLLAVSYYDGYPFSVWQDEDITIVLEGMIYNFSENEIQAQLKEIARCFVSGDEYRGLVKRFVESADGDYIVEIWQENEGKLLVFNDYFGRLPLYYYYCDRVCVLSRELKIILRFMPRINLNRAGLAEYLMFRYTLGDKTIFKDVFRLQPSQMLVAEVRAKGMQLECTDSAEFNFVLKDPFPDKARSVDLLRDHFLESVENRVRTLKRNGYRIIADISGGYDSRSVMAGLSKFTKNVTYFTVNLATNTADETLWGREVFQKLGSPGEHRSVHLDYSFRLQELGPLIYKTDGFVSYYATYIYYKDVQAIRNEVSGIAARFSGAAGAFIRHPRQHFHRSLLQGIDKGLYSALSLNAACQAVRLSPDEYRSELETYLDTYPEETPQDQLRRFYYEYYNDCVSGGAEDRERIHFWTVQPLWGLEFTRAIFSRFPLKWAGYRYFIQFMKALDPRLLQAPIYESNIRLESSASVNFYEALYRLNLFKTTFKVKMPTLYNFYRSLRGRQRVQNKIDHDLLQKIRYYYDKLDLAGDIFELSTIEENLVVGGRFPKVVLTLLIYLGELEKRYAAKL